MADGIARLDQTSDATAQAVCDLLIAVAVTWVCRHVATVALDHCARSGIPFLRSRRRTHSLACGSNLRSDLLLTQRPCLRTTWLDFLVDLFLVVRFRCRSHLYGRGHLRRNGDQSSARLDVGNHSNGRLRRRCNLFGGRVIRDRRAGRAILCTQAPVASVAIGILDALVVLEVQPLHDTLTARDEPQDVRVRRHAPGQLGEVWLDDSVRPRHVKGIGRANHPAEAIVSMRRTNLRCGQVHTRSWRDARATRDYNFSGHRWDGPCHISSPDCQNRDARSIRRGRCRISKCSD